MSEAAPSPRCEPLLWLQLLGLGVMPLEALLLLLLLAGSDPGPLPGLERLLCWAIGSLAPTLLLWNRPADVWSLLLVQTPLRGRRPLQQRLSTLQGTPLVQAGLLLGCGLSLALLVWIDGHAALASSFSPLEGGPRLVALLLAAAVLALLLWQWQQLLQALWLLSRPPAAVAAAAPMAPASQSAQRLGLGIPLLLLEPLDLPAPQPPQPRPARPAQEPPQPDPRPVSSRAPAGQSEPESAQRADSLPAAAPAAEPHPEPAEEASAEHSAEHPAEPAAVPADDPLTAPWPEAAEEPVQELERPAEPGPAAPGAATNAASDAPADRHPAAGQDSPEQISGPGAAVAVEPEQAAAGEQRHGLDQQVG